MFNRRSVRDAIMSRTINKVFFSPSERNMFRVVDVHLLANISNSRKELAAANKIFGSDLNEIKGNTVPQKNTEVQADITSLPVAIIILYRQVTITSDIIFVNRIPLLISISLRLKFGTFERLKNSRVSTLVKAIQKTRRPMRCEVLTLL